MDKNFQEIFNSIKNQKAFLKDRYKKILNIKPHLASKRHAMASDKWELIENEMVYVFEEKIKGRRGK